MRALEILHLEESDADAEMVREQLRAGEVHADIARVRNEEEFRQRIRRKGTDIILASDSCPGFDGVHVLSLAREKVPNVPFILLSRSADLSYASKSLGAGATGLVLKQTISELVPTVRRAAREAQQNLELVRAREQISAQAELLDLVSDSIIRCDANGTITSWNSGSQRIYGWTRKEAVGRNVHELLQTKFQDETANLEATLRTAAHWKGELKQVRRDGKPIFVASHCLSRNGAGAESSRLLINKDITERKDAEDALRQSEEKETLTGNFVMRPDGSVLTCNPAYLSIFGFSSDEEALSTNFMSLLRSRREGAQLLGLVRQKRTIEKYELEARQPSGETVYLVARLVGIFDEQDQVAQVQGYLFNDTKRKRLEQQLIQAQKMEGLGTLAGGIAHDFNNILAIILGYTGKLERWRFRPDVIPGAVHVIKEAVERGALLVQQLLASARQAEAHFSSFDLNDLIRELEKMLRATFPKMITFELHLQPEFPQLTADRSQIHQILLNLCVNARDAMPNGGTVILKTCLTPGSEVSELFTGADADRYATICVQDTGLGMTPEVKAHIFEPFFTTKERAKGTGLGLSVLYGVVNNHRGFVHVESEPNAGTSFCIYLPLAQERELRGPGARGPLPPQKPREPQTILFVDDEEMLRDLGVEILEGEGYRVITARDGMEAVELFEQHRDEIGLVVCDLGLPRLGGREVYRKMKKMKRSVRAIVASGYLEPAMRSEMLRAGVLETIQKPYEFHELIGKIQGVIGKARTEDDHPQLF